MSEVERLLQKLVEVDHRAAVWCACQCARTAFCYLAESEDRPRIAIETAEAWVRGQATKEACVEAAYRAYARDGHTEAQVSACNAACDAGRSVAVGDLNDYMEPYHAAHTSAVSYADDAARYNPDDYDAARERHLATLFALVASIRWPWTQPDPEQRNAAPAAVQVAWDFVSLDPRADHSIPELLEAHTRAGRLGLDWNDPVQRAIAERTTDEEHVRQLLTAPPEGGPPQAHADSHPTRFRNE